MSTNYFAELRAINEGNTIGDNGQSSVVGRSSCALTLADEWSMITKEYTMELNFRREVIFEK